MVRCRLIDGPAEGLEIDLPLRLCRDAMDVDDKVWAREMEDGGVAIVTSARPKRAPWLFFNRHRYSKIGKVAKDYAEYRFEHTTLIERCEGKTLAGSRCLKEAEHGQRVCRTHHDQDGELPAL